MIAAEITYTTKASFFRFGDRNKVNNRIEKNYLRKHGFGIDVQADEISTTYQKEVTPNDIVEFIIAYPNGANMYKNEVQCNAITINKNFKKLTGFNLTKNFIQKFEQNFLSNQVISDDNDTPF